MEKFRKLRKVFQALAALALAALLAGCDDLKGHSKAIARELGVPVELRVQGDDECLLAQLRRFAADYDALTPAQRAEARRAAQSRYRRIVLNPTARKTQLISGRAETLSMVVGTGYTPGNERTSIRPFVLAAKYLFDQRVFEGREPATRFEKGEQLGVTAEAAWDTSFVTLYGTYEWDVYRSVRSSTGDEAFARAVRARKIWYGGLAAQGRDVCGATAALDEALKP